MSGLLVLRALAGHWRRHRLELAALFVGLAVATALWSGVQALNAEARASYAEAGAVLAADRLAAVRAQDGGLFPREDYVALRRAGWDVSPVLEGTWRRGDLRLRIIGIDPLTLPRQASAGTDGGLEGAESFVTFVRPPWRAFAAAETAARLEGVAGLPPLEVSATLPPGTLLVDIGAAEALLGSKGALSRLTLAPEEAGRRLPPELAGHLRLEPPGEGAAETGRLTASFHLNLTAFGFLSYIVGLFIVYSAAGLAFEERRPMIRTLRACGVPARLLGAVLIAEIVVIALAAGLAGTVAGYVIAAALLPDVAASLGGLYGAQVAGSLSLSPSWWLAGLGMSVLGALGASAASLWRTWRLPLLAAARPEAWLGAERRRHRLQLGAAGLLALGTLGLLLFGTGLLAGFAAMGGLLLAAALALPPFLGAVLRFGAARARHPVVQWAWADSRQELPGLSLALMALLLALAVNLGVGTMVGSFRETFTRYLDQRLAQEIYVRAEDGAQAEAVADWLAARPGVTAVLPFWQAETRMAGRPAEVNGYDAHATYRENWPLLEARPGAWDAVAAGRAVFVSEQLARRGGIGLGATIEIPTPAGPWRVEVAGIHPDYGNPEGQIIAAREEVGRRWAEADRTRVGARADPAAVPEILPELRATFGLRPEQAYDQAAVKAASLAIFDRTFAVTVALNALTLAVAGVALLTSLLTLANARLGRLAPVWAAGLTPAALARIEAVRIVALGGLTTLAALPLGQAVAWMLTAVVNVRAFGWRLPVEVFPGQWASVAGLALATAALAALWPAWRLARSSPLALMRRFSNER